jgi:hypothetical protein
MIDEHSAPTASWLDALGTTVSVACAIQCTVFPFIIGVLPLLGLGFLAGDGIEKVFLATSAVLAVSSFTWGFRHHRQLYIFLFLFSGFGLVYFGRAWVNDTVELPFVVSGAMLIAGGHLLNRRLCQACAECDKALGKEA